MQLLYIIYIYIYIYIYIIYYYIYISIYIYNIYTRFKLPTLSSKVLIFTSKANIFVMDINNSKQLSLHGVSWVLPNLQMTVKYYLTWKNKVKT